MSERGRCRWELARSLQKRRLSEIEDAVNDVESGKSFEAIRCPFKTRNLNIFIKSYYLWQN